MTAKLKPRDFYEARAKSLIKDLRESQGVSYKELARRLEAYGVVVDDRVLITGVFSTATMGTSMKKAARAHTDSP